MKQLLFAVTVIGLIMFYACGSSNDPKAVMNEYFNTMDTYVTDLGKAASADDVVKAVEKTVASLKVVMPKLKELAKKYPELKNMQPGAKMPEALKEFEQKANELMPKMMGVMGVMMKYGQDPKVMAAMQKFQEVMKD